MLRILNSNSSSEKKKEAENTILRRIESEETRKMECALKAFALP